ncbi:MAG: hypothetical protein FD123_909 [Bacteroidetes bacterium]|nr:MAG: hypothetical protein FD123_909 [Bacteroidota bacterium]
MKKLFAVLALTGMMVAVSAPAVRAASNNTTAVAGDKEKKEKKKKAKKGCCAKDDQTRATAEGKGDAKSCTKGESKCCKGKTEAKTESKPQ